MIGIAGTAGVALAAVGAPLIAVIGCILVLVLAGVFLIVVVNQSNNSSDNTNSDSSNGQATNDDGTGTGDGQLAGGDEGDQGDEGTGCFAAGTPVTLANGKMKPIDMIAVGDFVLSRNEKTGSTALRRVSYTWVHRAKLTMILQLSGSEQLETTKAHRFFVPGQGFIGAEDLREGMPLGCETRENLKVEAVSFDCRETTVYNLEVEQDHTFFVGQSSIWVHNVKKDKGTYMA